MTSVSGRVGLVVGRFHAVTKAQGAWLASLAQAPVERLVCVLTSAQEHGSRRNPLAADARVALLTPALARIGKPFDVVRVDDVPEASAWVDHLLATVQRQTGRALTAQDCALYSANRDVDALFSARGFSVVAQDVDGLTPHELVQRIADGRPWEAEATPETVAQWKKPGVIEAVRALFGQRLLNDDGELGHARDFDSYGAQMDASLRQKLDDLTPFVRPGRLVDKGCGTGKLMVELSRLFPGSGLVGVDLSKEFLRRCDENTYLTGDVALVFGNVIEQNVAAGSASTVIFSSVMHEVHSYSDYRREEIDRALSNAFVELEPGGHVLVRDGVSPGEALWQLELVTDEAKATFARFATEFRRGQGAAFEALPDGRVRLTAHLANEFLCKKDYQKNWHIEVHEEFGPLTLVGWGAALARAGFEVLALREYVNGWIAEHRYQGTVRVFDDAGAPLPWPATNCVVAGRKPG